MRLTESPCPAVRLSRSLHKSSRPVNPMKMSNGRLFVFVEFTTTVQPQHSLPVKEVHLVQLIIYCMGDDGLFRF